MSNQLPRSEPELEELASFYATHDVSDEIGAGEVVTPEPMITTSLRLPGVVVEKLRTEAANLGIRYTSLIRDVLVAYVTEPELSSQVLASRLDGLEQEYDRRLRRLEDAQRHISEIASDSAAAYTAMPHDTDDGPVSSSVDG